MPTTREHVSMQRADHVRGPVWVQACICLAADHLTEGGGSGGGNSPSLDWTQCTITPVTSLAPSCDLEYSVIATRYTALPCPTIIAVSARCVLHAANAAPAHSTAALRRRRGRRGAVRAQTYPPFARIRRLNSTRRYLRRTTRPVPLPVHSPACTAPGMLVQAHAPSRLPSHVLTMSWHNSH